MVNHKSQNLCSIVLLFEPLISKSLYRLYTIAYWQFFPPQRCVLPVSFQVDLLLYGSNKSTGKETGKTHLCKLSYKKGKNFLICKVFKQKPFVQTSTRARGNFAWGTFNNYVPYQGRQGGRRQSPKRDVIEQNKVGSQVKMAKKKGRH